MGVVFSDPSGSLEHSARNDICPQFSNSIIILSEVGSAKLATPVDRQDSCGYGNGVRIKSLGERSIDVFQNSVQFYQPLFRLHSTSDLRLPSESYAENEIILHGAITQYWQDNIRDLPDATSHLVDVQLQDDLGVIAWLAAGQFSFSDFSLHQDLSQIA